MVKADTFVKLLPQVHKMNYRNGDYSTNNYATKLLETKCFGICSVLLNLLFLISKQLIIIICPDAYCKVFDNNNTHNEN